MIGLISKYVVIAVTTILILMPASVGAFNFTSEPCKVAPNNPACATGDTNPVIDIINTASAIIATAAGVAAVVMLILGGYSYITSGGNPEALKKGRSRIIYGLIGAVVVALSWTIIRFITDNFIK